MIQKLYPEELNFGSTFCRKLKPSLNMQEKSIDL